MSLPRLHRLAVSSLLLPLTEAGGDPGVFCYRMGVGIFSNGRAPLQAFAPWIAGLAPLLASAFHTKRNPVACLNLYSTFFARFMTLKD